ncbi:Transcriptional regulator [Nitrincola lacisaponensis]|uniref:Transcriptional regulator n=1 Tax=Nitrincola lacisaponensis TaxID=267850 RepID=A0A063Y6P5_9GAMM|nr:LysR family transcriptional regulator [Nitrincola lacisaponensis]KDE40810.1 Transcriptional regulator [Nitrincola lacisaponensis]
MRPSQAEAFLAVLESGSIIDAARHLNRSRTTISAAISALEDDLNAELFERSGKAVRATDLAWAIQPDCMRLIQTYRQIQARCELERGGIETTLRLARDDALPEAVWLEAMHALKQRFPLTGISVYLAPPQELPALVSSQTVDIAYGLDLNKHTDHRITMTPLSGLRMIMVASVQHPLSKLPEVKPDDLITHTQVTLAFVDSDEQLVPDILNSSNYLALTQYELIRDAVMKNAGWAWLPQPLADPAIQAGHLKPLKTAQALLWQTFSSFHFSNESKGQVTLRLEEILAKYLTQFS